MLEKKIFKEGVNKLLIAFPNFKLESKEQIDLWYSFFKNFKYPEFNKKIDNCIKFCRHTPTIADVLDLSKEDKVTRANAAAYITD